MQMYRQNEPLDFWAKEIMMMTMNMYNYDDLWIDEYAHNGVFMNALCRICFCFGIDQGVISGKLDGSPEADSEQKFQQRA